LHLWFYLHQTYEFYTLLLDFFQGIVHNKNIKIKMKQEIAPPSKGMLIVYRCIVALLLLLVVMVIGGSIYALVRPKDSRPLFTIGPSVQTAHAGEGSGLDDGAVGIFTGIGRLRISTAGQGEASSDVAYQDAAHQDAVTVILSISFPYPADDRPFSEELASRIGDFRSIATGYFSSLPRDKLIGLDEEAAKNEVLKRYNEMLRLGRIETLYFSDFMVIE
jgi:flagellar basal body-associated protein FliL